MAPALPGSKLLPAASTRLIPRAPPEQSLTGTAPATTFDMLTHPDMSYEIDVSKTLRFPHREPVPRAPQCRCRPSSSLPPTTTAPAAAVTSRARRQ